MEAHSMVTKVLAERKCITKRVSIEEGKPCSATKKRKVSIEYNPVTKKMKLLMVENCLVTTKRKVSIQDIIPEELIEQMLVRLDVVDLIRCKSVCKSWKSLISHPHFIKAHQDHCINNNDNGQARIDRVTCPFCHCRTGRVYDIVGSSNGLVCMNNDQGDEFLVANPWTREERMVQKWTREERMVQKWTREERMVEMHLASSESCWGFRESCWGFGYDAVTNDYKIVYGVKESMYQTSFQVLSLKSNVWKHIGHVNGVYPCGERATLCNGALHWLMHHEGQEKSASIISFDLSKEVFKEIPQPDDARYNPNKEFIPYEDLMLGFKDESLCIWRFDRYNQPNDMWIMRKYSVKESWEPLGSNFERKNDFTPYFDILLPDISTTHDAWFLKKCMCIPTTTIMQSLISPHSSGQ